MLEVRRKPPSPGSVDVAVIVTVHPKELLRDGADLASLAWDELALAEPLLLAVLRELVGGQQSMIDATAS